MTETHYDNFDLADGELPAQWVSMDGPMEGVEATGTLQVMQDGKWVEINGIQDVGFDWAIQDEIQDFPNLAPMLGSNRSVTLDIKLPPWPQNVILFSLLTGMKPERKRDRRAVERWRKYVRKAARNLSRVNQRLGYSINS